jgi:hypothetical protein
MTRTRCAKRPSSCQTSEAERDAARPAAVREMALRSTERQRPSPAPSSRDQGTCTCSRTSFTLTAEAEEYRKSVAAREAGVVPELAAPPVTADEE